jgi:hypothetical protein
MYILDVVATIARQCFARLPYNAQHCFLQNNRAKSLMAFPSQGTKGDGGQKDSRREDKVR